MKAALLDAYGAELPFRVAEIPAPAAAPGTVLVRVRAASVNPADMKIRARGGALAPALPAVLGMDLAGEVVDVGADVTRFRVGDRVYGCAGGLGALQGTLAQFIAADERLLAEMPARLSFREAAALPLVGITAWEGLIDRARIEAGQQVLVFGATGGVGHVAVQLAKARGAQVTAVVSSSRKAQLARRLGAAHVVLRTSARYQEELAAATHGRGFDIVFDTVGGDHLNEAIRHARLYGQVITLVTRQPYDLGEAMNKALSIHIVFMLVPMIHDFRRERHGAILSELSALVDAGQLAPLLDASRFDLHSATAAFDKLARGEAIGKIVIDIE